MSKTAEPETVPKKKGGAKKLATPELNLTLAAGFLS